MPCPPTSPAGSRRWGPARRCRSSGRSARPPSSRATAWSRSAGEWRPRCRPRCSTSVSASPSASSCRTTGSGGRRRGGRGAHRRHGRAVGAWSGRHQGLERPDISAHHHRRRWFGPATSSARALGTVLFVGRQKDVIKHAGYRSTRSRCRRCSSATRPCSRRRWSACPTSARAIPAAVVRPSTALTTDLDLGVGLGAPVAPLRRWLVGSTSCPHRHQQGPEEELLAS